MGVCAILMMLPFVWMAFLADYFEDTPEPSTYVKKNANPKLYWYRLHGELLNLDNWEDTKGVLRTLQRVDLGAMYMELADFLDKRKFY
jgi:hypothetical protein